MRHLIFHRNASAVRVEINNKNRKLRTTLPVNYFICYVIKQHLSVRI